MSTEKMYDRWSATYDQVENKTRDLEKQACERVLESVRFKTVIAIGSSTGKNTSWLASRASRVISVDLSAEMQAIAREKVQSGSVDFIQGDVRGPWTFLGEGERADLMTFSLVLEHVEDLKHVFREAFAHISPGGHLYICELHPFKQYTGSKARFEAAGEINVLACFLHHVTDYTDAATGSGFAVERIDEWFDDGDRTQIPRLISFLFKRED
jgi:ubiquinone/menaquinone biosynthesis C-methylase UbiE